ncbi:MAG: 23S rRNA (adenine(2503)-C(2))-methyltransferase RlmN [Anaerolineae bacterium]|uniref:23S rRNA (adenine(2503)-C(2))-methyltransferase RlmN n=1 Tax=Promineifilum sp. TaxID=2664178 RepID=UPI001DFC4C9B|nr:23S rRNA (adenine(2503)-C(2))-methyltransferase RlmN [Anaerolineales bacterium]MCB8935628.1 23S rRNA (adenine(2503)-C(2))-methyltransferase RlmN [Promineifilum sp.]MCO5180768.1 23S rRNA (adenine(2503)-C(2))-methyltransferase RlmN [Promineifilum sp.]MCW5845967.1 23S rRNA (adenine(2503)-C(2))-methyltransferase RlmN [Anaerolineae bacterium]
MPDTELTNLYDLTLPELTALLAGWGQPAYRARQLWEWLYRHYAGEFETMTTLPGALRERLAAETTLAIGKIALSQHSSDGQTEKVLFQLPDGQYIETVLMRYQKRRTLCISTQAGCAMGCVFCATGQMGFMRHLSVAEIVGQAIYFARQLAAEGQHVTNIVMMGMGEPLHNYDNTLAAVDRLTDPAGMNLGARKITISTVGLIPAIRRYADEQRQTPLAVSLHAATDEERSRLLPVNRRWPLAELMEACRYYVMQTGRRMTFEWALIAGENDTEEQAHKLGTLLRGMLGHVNLIPLNPTAGYGGIPSSPERVGRFQEILTDYGVTSTVRVRRGIDIQAGCGQLRDRHLMDVKQQPAGGR